ncbi:MAG TPA: periplasmic heavy metal sensor [Candidatus Saccharimonadales bacterium]|nr:periplasmic heavy metal sensor [Candidatus Saccharimonadales bacterium]
MLKLARNRNITTSIGKKLILAFLSILILLSVFQVANAAPRKPISGRMFTPEMLLGYCNEHGGIYFPPGVGGAYACLLPDGTLIVCGGGFPRYCVESRTLEDEGLGLSEVQTRNIKAMALEYEKFRIRAEADLDLAEVDVAALAEDDKSDMGAIENALKKSEAAQTALRQGGIKALRAISGVLTPEQREKWRNRIEMRLGAKSEEGYPPGGHEGVKEPKKKPIS